MTYMYKSARAPNFYSHVCSQTHFILAHLSTEWCQSLTVCVHYSVAVDSSRPQHSHSAKCTRGFHPLERAKEQWCYLKTCNSVIIWDFTNVKEAFASWPRRSGLATEQHSSPNSASSSSDSTSYNWRCVVLLLYHLLGWWVEDIISWRLCAPGMRWLGCADHPSSSFTLLCFSCLSAAEGKYI